ncbi:MAG: PD40 domain-containing protein, partial [Bacteroidaceae bacterium]|nr:PD40 domain-containing protein [Bacteroidaceae bacterium]
MKKITHILYSFLRRVTTPSLSGRVRGGSVLFLLLLLSACTPHPTDVQKSEELPPIYPDYVDVTIPKNIAPLNFLVRGEVDAVEARVEPLARRSQGGERKITINAKGNELCFSLDEWRELLLENAGKELKVTVSARDQKTGNWTEYRSFLWHVVEDEVDPYLSYRLIEPDYEVFSHLEIRERCVENFEERNLSTYKLVGNRCMNCHTHSVQQPNLSMMYVRGEGGGAILNENGVLRKLNIQSPTGGSVYFTFSPSGRYVCFSTNVIIPAFHARSEKRLEVYDDASDVYVFDLQEERVISSALVADSMVFETFPAFSPDGKSIYFCSAPRVSLPAQIADLQYSLCRIGFDERTGTFMEDVDT